MDLGIKRILSIFHDHPSVLDITAYNVGFEELNSNHILDMKIFFVLDYIFPIATMCFMMCCVLQKSKFM